MFITRDSEKSYRICIYVEMEVFMEDIQTLIEFISILKEKFFSFLGQFLPETIRNEIKKNLDKSLVLTITIVLISLLLGVLEFETIIMFSGNFLFIYGLVFIGICFAKYISHLIIKLFPFNGKILYSIFRVLIALILVIIAFKIGPIINSTNIGGVKVKFTEDVLAQFVIKDESEYNVKIPKDTIVFLDGDDINQIDNAIRNGNEYLNLFFTENVENIFLLKKSNKIQLKEDKPIYLVEKRIRTHSENLQNEEDFNINSINDQLYTFNLLPETKLRLTEDTDVVLLEDAKVEIYRRKYKYLLSGFLYLISISTSIYVIAPSIIGRIMKRKIKRLLIMLKKIMNMK